MRRRKSWYSLAKTLAEQAFWDWAAQHPNIRCATICPGMVLGPVMTESQARHTPRRYLEWLNGSVSTIPQRATVPCDVRDVARLHILAATVPAAAGQRYAVVTQSDEPITLDQMRAALVRAGAVQLADLPLGEGPFERGVDLWDCSKAANLLEGFTPLDDTMAAMYKSFKSLGLAK